MKIETLARTALASAAIAVPMLAIATVPSRADVPGYVRTACKADYKKHCPNYAIGSSELRSCMVAVANVLSSRCIDALERSGEKRRKS